MGFIKVLRLRHLAILWLSQILSAIGDYFYLIAVMWIAVKVAGSEAGIVAAAESGAMLGFGLLGGVYADQWNRRTAMITVDILRAAAVVALLNSPAVSYRMESQKQVPLDAELPQC